MGPTPTKKGYKIGRNAAFTTLAAYAFAADGYPYVGAESVFLLVVGLIPLINLPSIDLDLDLD